MNDTLNEHLTVLNEGHVPTQTPVLVFRSKLDDARLERAQMNDALLTYETDQPQAEGDYCEVVSAEGTTIPGEVVYYTAPTHECQYGCDRDYRHVHVSIS